jgi:hypothetical protein
VVVAAGAGPRRLAREPRTPETNRDGEKFMTRSARHPSRQPSATPLGHDPIMTTPRHPQRTLWIGTPGAVIEQWWCPVCGAAAHRVYRPGRPNIYCSNACRQRAYRYRKANRLRTTATPQAPCESAFTFGASPGRRHALRHRHDFMANLSDGRRRRVTVCGALARPTRYASMRHFDFLIDSANSCRSCIALVLPLGQPAPQIVKPDWPSMMDHEHVHVPGSPPSFDDADGAVALETPSGTRPLRRALLGEGPRTFL